MVDALALGVLVEERAAICEGSASPARMGASNVVTEGRDGGGAGLGDREQDFAEARRGAGRVSQT